MKRILTKEQAVAALNAITGDDREAAHSDADDILLDFLAGAGDEEIVNAWHMCARRCRGFWYA